MSDFTEDVLSGLCCETCGVYFVQAHGHPVLCRSCWGDLTKAEQERSQLARHREL